MRSEAILLLVFGGCVIFAGVFAGAETGAYQLSRVRLQLGIEKKRWLSLLLGESLRDSSGMLIALLLGTNLAHYFATSSMTYIVLGRLEAEHLAELLATVISAPIFFVFSELIPKNIFFYQADRLMPPFSPLILTFQKALAWLGVVPVLKRLSILSSRLIRSGKGGQKRIASVATARGHIERILVDTREEGLLSPVQADIIERLANVSRMDIRSAMTPLSKAQMVDSKSDRTTLLNCLRRHRFTRYLVYEGSRVNIIGHINVYDCLCAGEAFAGLDAFVKELRRVPARTTVLEAINLMRNHNEKIVLVTRTGYGYRPSPIGLVTMKDLVEELLGELAEW